MAQSHALEHRRSPSIFAPGEITAPSISAVMLIGAAPPDRPSIPMRACGRATDHSVASSSAVHLAEAMAAGDAPGVRRSQR
jgi:hypothetical protein